MSGIDRLIEIMAQLRDPNGGCPWDLEQNFESISPFTIEEAYEVDEAIARGDLEALRDELGDLLFQVVFQARIAEESGIFDFEGVIDAITSKLIRRHPHVFADAEVPGTREARTAIWEQIKAEEREAAGASDTEGESATDPFSGVPRKLPALARSAKLAGRVERLLASSGAAKPSSAREQSDRIGTQLTEIERRLAPPDEALDRETALELIGEGLQAWVGLARSLGVDAEQALREADDRQIERVRRRARAADVRQAGNSPNR